MEKDEKILKKIDKLLKLYQVSDEERKQFLADIQDAKYDEEESVESPTEELGENEEEVGEEKVETEDVENKPDEEEHHEEELPSEEVGEEKPFGEDKPLEEVANDSEEQVKENNPMEQEEQLPQFDAQAQVEELKKTNEALSARLASLEDIVSKLSIDKPEDQTLGASPTGNPIDETNESMFDIINKKRVG